MPKISDLPAATAVNANDLFVVVDQSGAAITKKAVAATVAGEILELAAGIKSDIAGILGGTQIVNIVSLTQAQYDSITSPRADTLYLVRD